MAALTNSPFGLLDAYSSLHLITDFVHEDDALCLALVCCALRDALWTRFPMRPKGHPHVGKRLRTRDVAMGTLGSRVNADGILALRYDDSNSLPGGIGRLVHLPKPGLTHLLCGNWRLSGRLKTLPEGLWSLLRLEVLDLGDIGLLALPQGIQRLKMLRILNIKFNTNLVLPEGLWSMVRLEELDIGAICLDALPDGIGRLSGLRKLILGNNRGLLLPGTLWSLTGLQELDLRDCGLKALPRASRR